MRSRLLRLALGVALAVSGCAVSYEDGYSCLNPDKGHKDANGEPDPCHYHDPDAGDAGEALEPCEGGQCLPLGPLEWSMPALLWTGPEADAPPCPEDAPVLGYEGHAGLTAPVTCGACSCATPAGTCGLPTKITVFNTATCPAPAGAVATSFDPPAGWGGTCTTANAIPAGKLCNGVPCAQSVLVGPMALTQGGCLPVEPPKAQPAPTWGTFARACLGTQYTSCATPGEMCAPAPPPDAGFRQCIHRDADPAAVTCPPSYPDKLAFYDGFEDTRACSPCTCGAPVGSSCSATISVYGNSACGSGAMLTLTANESTPKCGQVPSGAALASKVASAKAGTFTPGTCQPSGGQPVGSAKATGGSVFCCRP